MCVWFFNGSVTKMIATEPVRATEQASNCGSAFVAELTVITCLNHIILNLNQICKSPKIPM